jgi:hypothetical protein
MKFNRRGVALILCYTVIAVLTLLGSVFLFRSVSEGNVAVRHVNSVQAFWSAEAGLAQAYYNQINSVQQPGNPVGFPGGSSGTYEIAVSDTSSSREIKVTANYGSSSRIVKAYLKRRSYVFDNTLSVGGDLSLNAALAIIHVNGQTRYSGAYYESADWSIADFQDKQHEPDISKTTIIIPDCNQNSTPGEFEDFVLFGQETLTGYPANEVIYIQSDNTVNIFPSSGLAGKKVVFVEGSSPGTGDVNIYLNTTWQSGQDLTIISTGTITYYEPIEFHNNSRLSTVSWEGYGEKSVFIGMHNSVIFTQGNANFEDKFEIGYFQGNVISNNDVSLVETVALETWDFSNRCQQGDYPPGFAALSSGSGSLSDTLTDWQEE